MFESLGVFLSRVRCFSAFVDTATSFPKPLSAEEELKYLKAFKENGDMVAREKLITHNLRLVPHIVKKYIGTTIVESDDMISVGSIGLIKAVDSFDYTKGIKLATYASKCIDNEILMLIRMNKKHKDVLSIECPISVDKSGNEILIADMLADDGEEIEDQVNSNFVLDKIQEVVDTKLSPREREIVYKRFGLKNQKVQTQNEVAKQIGISRSYVSRIENKSIKLIKKHLDPNIFEKK